MRHLIERIGPERLILFLLALLLVEKVVCAWLWLAR